jgi:hypothetical protein
MTGSFFFLFFSQNVAPYRRFVSEYPAMPFGGFCSKSL